MRKYECISTLDDLRLLRNFPLMKFHLRFKWEERRKDWRLFDFIIPLRVGSSLQRWTLTSKLVLEIQAPAPWTSYTSSEFQLAGHVWLVGLTSVFAPANYWRNGLLRFWLAADFISMLFYSWLMGFWSKFLHYHQSYEVETASSVRYLLPHWIDSTFADGS